ncbi:MAG: hypothetical protein R3B91_06825 [Planctomycetaceae bacterium]
MNKLLHSLTLIVFIPVSAIAADGPQLIETYSWEALAGAGQLLNGEVVKDESEGTVLKLEKLGEQSTLTLLEIEKPPVTSQIYVLDGRVRYEGVSEQGFLETWNYFPDGGAYFSRTLGISGPMQSLSGESGWRDFSLPFSFEASSSAEPPSRIQLNVVLPKEGTVWLSEVSLRQLPSLVSATTPDGAWWSDRTSGYVGTWMGTTLGLLGALIGVLVGLGRARRFTLSIQILGIAAGTVCLIMGVIALIAGQPYAVYYPLLLCGLIGSVVLGLLRPVVKNRYAHEELRRMQAVDV